MGIIPKVKLWLRRVDCVARDGVASSPSLACSLTDTDSHNLPRFVVISILNRYIHERKLEHPEARGGRTRRRRGQQQNARTNSLLGLPKERRKTQAAVLEQGFIVDQFEAAMMMTAAVRHCRLTDGRTERDGGGRTEWCSCCSSLPASRRCPRVRPIVHASNLFIDLVGASGVRCVRVHPLLHFEQKFHIYLYNNLGTLQICHGVKMWSRIIMSKNSTKLCSFELDIRRGKKGVVQACLSCLVLCGRPSSPHTRLTALAAFVIARCARYCN